MHCSSAAARSACMHAHNSSSIERRPPFGSLTRSWIWILALRMAFSSSLELGYVVLGLFFPFPNSLSTWQVRLRSLTVADNDRRSHLPLSPGTMSSILFAKPVSFEHSVSSLRPVITSRREKKDNNKAKVFQHPIDSQSASCSLSSRHVLSARVVGARPRCSEFLSNRKYRYRSYTQTDDTHCWPWDRLNFRALKLGVVEMNAWSHLFSIFTLTDKEGLPSSRTMTVTLCVSFVS